jgi:hypothetical protein
MNISCPRLKRERQHKGNAQDVLEIIIRRKTFNQLWVSWAVSLNINSDLASQKR